jgi:hypothetical protein
MKGIHHKNGFDANEFGGAPIKRRKSRQRFVTAPQSRRANSLKAE